MNDEYSNREIDHMFTDIKTQLDRIEAQTTRTNGRVSVLENWRSGIVAVLAFLAIAIPIFLTIYK